MQVALCNRGPLCRRPIRGDDTPSARLRPGTWTGPIVLEMWARPGRTGALTIMAASHVG